MGRFEQHPREEVAASLFQAPALQKLRLKRPGSQALGAWFLGPKAENGALLLRLIQRAIATHTADRRRYFKGDPEWITEERRESPAFRQAVEHLEKEFDALLGALDGSVPFYSYRYQGHMLWDITLPSIVGYFAAMLYNQNNVAAEASPVTTWLEMQVGDDLCEMLGYYVPDREPGATEYEGRDPEETIAWGHITCDGSVANMESLWAARNLKYYPLGLAAAIAREPALKPARGLAVELPTGGTAALVELEPWQLLNLRIDDVLELPQRLKDEYELPVDVDAILDPYTIQDAGLIAFKRRFAAKTNDPVVLAPATAHYSWPKGAALMGLGKKSVMTVQVDLDARMDVNDLRRRLDQCVADRRPIVMLVAVLGTTEESAVDPLAAIMEEREKYRRRGLEFWVHVDAAWGGYFASMLREADEPPSGDDDPDAVLFGPKLSMSKYVNDQYAALDRSDSITVDPHKAGYIPYPAGGLCYRNSAMRNLVSFTAPVVYHGGVDPTVGVYGIEGSKAGAAPAAVYLSHDVIRPDQSGYGRLLGRCMWNSKRLYCGLVTMAQPNDRFLIVPFQRLPSERAAGSTPEDVAEEIERIREEIVPRSNAELRDEFQRRPKLLEWFRQLGSDQVIVTYAFNFIGENGPNKDPELLNKLNTVIFRRLSLAQKHEDLPNTPLFITGSKFEVELYGTKLLRDFKRRLGVEDHDDTPVQFLISTTMNPWLTDTAAGNFVPTIIDSFRAEVLKIIGEDTDFR